MPKSCPGCCTWHRQKWWSKRKQIIYPINSPLVDLKPCSFQRSFSTKIYLLSTCITLNSFYKYILFPHKILGILGTFSWWFTVSACYSGRNSAREKSEFWSWLWPWPAVCAGRTHSPPLASRSSLLKKGLLFSFTCSPLSLDNFFLSLNT